MSDDLFMEVIDAETLQRRVGELADEISEAYHDREPTFVGVLTGCVPFLADLVREMQGSMKVEFIALTRFGEEGKVSIAMDSLQPLAGGHIILVEDIVDTGLTLSTVRKMLETRHIESLEVVTLLDKAPRRIVDVPLEYRGFEVGDEFLLGYGLDYEGKYRNLRSLWAVMDLPAFREDPASLGRHLYASDRLSA
ncbi:MAG: hypoxanthine phosphoribosyltransferase [Acidimicrobiia bacterium]|nr:hypoxanthine phosphoribosyltransferase [Acidimicrobiia bacterium]